MLYREPVQIAQSITLPSLGGRRWYGAHGGKRGAVAYHGGRPPTACL